MDSFDDRGLQGSLDHAHWVIAEQTKQLCEAEARISALEKDAERWQPIETADSNALALLYAPPEALFVEPAKHLGEFRVAAPRNWTWATHWMPLPAPPAIDAALSEKGRT